MAALQCDICGGKLVAKAGGLFECEFCGMQYDKSRIQEMVQEIKGTVKVEGTVQVQGTVSVDTQANKENLLKRIAICAGDKAFGKIQELVEQLLSLDPECADAYLWRLLARQKLQSEDAIFRQDMLHLNIVERSPDWEKALRYSTPEKSRQLQQRMADAKAYLQKEDPLLRKRFQQIQPVQDLMFASRKGIFCLKADGTVLVTYRAGDEWLGEMASWTGVKKLIEDTIFDYVLGLRWDGTILLAAKNKDKRKVELANILRLIDVKDLVKSSGFIVALTRSGELVSTKDGKYHETLHDTYYCCTARDWTDVESLQVAGYRNGHYDNNYFYVTLGLTADGRVRCATTQLAVPGLKPEWWESKKNVIRISDSGDLLFADGTILKLHRETPEKGHWLTFSIDDKGICNDSAYNRGRDIMCYDSSFVLRADGTVSHCPTAFSGRVNQEEVTQWTGIVAMQYCGLGNYHSAQLGLREDGTVLLAWPEDAEGKFCVDGWKLFESLDTFQAERDAQRRKAEEEIRIAQLKREEEARIARRKQEEAARIRQQRRYAGLCQHCGGDLKGFLSKKCVSCGRLKDY